MSICDDWIKWALYVDYRKSFTFIAEVANVTHELWFWFIKQYCVHSHLARARLGSAGSLTVTAGIGLLKELLHLLSVLDTHLKDQPSPVDWHDPTDKVDGGQHLDSTNSQLCLTPLLGVADAWADHGTGAGKDDIEDEAEVWPDSTETGKCTDQVPKLGILLPVLHHGLLGVFCTLFSQITSRSLVITSTIAVVLLGLCDAGLVISALFSLVGHGSSSTVWQIVCGLTVIKVVLCHFT